MNNILLNSVQKLKIFLKSENILFKIKKFEKNVNKLSDFWHKIINKIWINFEKTFKNFWENSEKFVKLLWQILKIFDKEYLKC